MYCNFWQTCWIYDLQWLALHEPLVCIAKLSGVDKQGIYAYCCCPVTGWSGMSELLGAFIGLGPSRWPDVVGPPAIGLTIAGEETGCWILAKRLRLGKRDWLEGTIRSGDRPSLCPPIARNSAGSRWGGISERLKRCPSYNYKSTLPNSNMYYTSRVYCIWIAYLYV